MGSYNYRVFGWFQRKFKMSELQAPPDVRAAFLQYTDGAAHMTAEQLLKFLVEYQGEEGCTAADAEAIMAKVFQSRHHIGRRHGLMTLDDFFDFLFQDLNSPINSQVLLNYCTLFSMFLFKCFEFFFFEKV